MDRKEMLLLTVATAEDGGLTPVQLQKALFLIGESKLDGLPTDYYEFVPYNYGPFDPTIYNEADDLGAIDQVAQIPVPGRSWAVYHITPSGQAEAQRIRSKSDPNLVAHVRAIVQWITGLSFSELLRAIYSAHPQFRENSVFQY